MTQNLDKRNKGATVYRILKMWDSGGLKAVHEFLNDEETILLKGSWGIRIKEKIEKKRYDSVAMEIENVYLKFNITRDEILSDKTKGTD